MLYSDSGSLTSLQVVKSQERLFTTCIYVLEVLFAFFRFHFFLLYHRIIIIAIAHQTTTAVVTTKNRKKVV